ncbi:type IV secretion system protein VirB10 [Mesorhizobium albiziae]|uniref:Type IV secretion system protein VirB10 n=1 Tax=Neomesorhizobium albiziae TaxID=335020 RepID=A0A1I4EV66_9HYPH|nr:TrbI/VirB10 family protein [Mesorhizobium albiziae]GLS33460.1 conjugal transfer protein TrbI [Mesorhizobium albiziae]SFL09635.1 type IV secretion system protein VirB10 [Mesorhizobium albiziae]
MPDSPKQDPETLVLKASPRRVVRFKRKLLIGISAIALAAIFGVTWLALKNPLRGIGEQAQELYDTERKPVPDGLAGLPGDYGQLRPEAPKLGPPLPGDLGRPILERQRQLGLAPGPNKQDQAAEAERQRRAQQALEAREAGVFFQLANRSATTAAASLSAQATPAPGQAAGVQPSAVDASRLALDPEHDLSSVALAEDDQNNQQRKLDFVNQRDTSGIYNPHELQTPASPYQVMAGSIIAASLITGINSDLPGFVIAQVTENVFDTVTGSTLLIPQGARLIGSYDSVVAFGQKRALLVWRRIILPDGSSIEIDNLPATDAAGYAGLEDKVDYHTWQLLKGIALSTLLGVGTELSFGNDESDLVRAIRESAQENASRAGERIVEKNLNIQPTITVRPGWPLRVIVHKDLVLRPWKADVGQAD